MLIDRRGYFHRLFYTRWEDGDSEADEKKDLFWINLCCSTSIPAVRRDILILFPCGSNSEDLVSFCFPHSESVARCLVGGTTWEVLPSLRNLGALIGLA